MLPILGAHRVGGVHSILLGAMRLHGQRLIINIDLSQKAGPAHRAAIEQHMQMLDNNPDRVGSCFQDPIVKYAA